MLHPANHALTLVTAEGIEVLMHIGLDTINLKGRGFGPKVKNGDKVKAGMNAIMRPPNQILHLIVGPNADQYAAEMAGQLA